MTVRWSLHASAVGAALASIFFMAGCGGGGGGGGGCDLVAHGSEAARIQVSNGLDHTIGWRIKNDPSFSQLSAGECSQMGVPAGDFTITVTSCANPSCNSPHLAEIDVSDTIAAGETVAYLVDAAFFSP
jgi:hypothetical protein